MRGGEGDGCLSISRARKGGRGMVRERCMGGWSSVTCEAVGALPTPAWRAGTQPTAHAVGREVRGLAWPWEEGGYGL